MQEEERAKGGGNWKERYQQRYDEAEKQQVKAVADKLVCAYGAGGVTHSMGRADTMRDWF